VVLLALYQVLRIAITDAIAIIPDTDRDWASYQIAVRAAQALVTGPRRPAPTAAPRVCARRARSPLSRCSLHPRGMPRTCLRITTLTTVISPGHKKTQHAADRPCRRQPGLKSPPLRLNGNPRWMIPGDS